MGQQTDSQKIIRSLMNNIYDELNLLPVDDPLGLLGNGYTGCILFSILFQKHFSEDLALNLATLEKFEILITKSHHLDYSSFCTGEAGIQWLYVYLNRAGLLSFQDVEALEGDSVEFLEEKAINYINEENYDFLHGAIGIGWHLLYRSNVNKNFIKNFISILDNNFNQYEFASVEYLDGNKSTVNINLGLAHGLPSILKFCLQCYTQNICKTNAHKLSLKLITHIIRYKNKDCSISFFPAKVNLEGLEATDTYSRLAWCYGDLTIGYILFQAGSTFKDQYLIDFALEILYSSTKRRSINYTNVYDAGICHGSAGIAHIFNRLWHYTQNPIFKESSDFWINKTLDFAVYKDGIAGYKKFNPMTNQYERNDGLLGGTAGIGLVLLSYLTSDFSWDYCLMLNNLSDDGTF